MNGVETTLGDDPAHPGWLKTIISKVSAAAAQSLTYTREGGGRVHERDDAVNGTVETFGYDGLERLTSWSWTGKVGARSVQYVDDDLGNLLQRKVTAGPGTTATYARHGASGLGLHQASSDGIGTSYAYDTHGNQTGTPGRTLAFNSFDMPTTVTASSSTYTMTLRRGSRALLANRPFGGRALLVRRSLRGAH